MWWISEKIQADPWAVSINFPATKGKLKRVREENNRNSSPPKKAVLYGVRNLKIWFNLLRFCLLSLLFSSGSNAVPRCFAIGLVGFRLQKYRFRGGFDQKS
jgi:hypothetical protein